MPILMARNHSGWRRAPDWCRWGATVVRATGGLVLLASKVQMTLRFPWSGRRDSNPATLTFAKIAEPIDDHTCRLVIRSRGNSLMARLQGPAQFVMQRKMMIGSNKGSRHCLKGGLALEPRNKRTGYVVRPPYPRPLAGSRCGKPPVAASDRPAWTRTEQRARTRDLGRRTGAEPALGVPRSATWRGSGRARYGASVFPGRSAAGRCVTAAVAPAGRR
jgi:hypothetical protein